MPAAQFTLPGLDAGFPAEVAPSRAHRIEMRPFSADGRRLRDVRILSGVQVGALLDGSLVPVARTVAYNLDGTRHRCNSSCQHARGKICECACGGANHGKGYIASLSVPSLSL